MCEANILQMAYLVGQQSKCVSWKVGAIIAKEGRIISTGYNGSPAGQCNCIDHAANQGWLIPAGNFVYLNPEMRDEHRLWSSRNEIHAEMNAILFAAKHGTSIDGADMFVTVSPCEQCAKAIANSGIRTLYYCEDYDMNHAEWFEILRGANISVVRYDKKYLTMINHTQVFSQQSKENLEMKYDAII